jgi:hypothetical protein
MQMQRRAHRNPLSNFWRWLPLGLVAACAGVDTPQDPSGGPSRAGGNTTAASSEQIERACHELHTAPPHQWRQRIPAVHDAGSSAEPFLIRELQDNPAAPGAQASLATLGRIGGEDSVELCRQLVIERGPLAIEAALALGDLPSSEDDPALRQCVADRHGDASLRTAAACSLARHGERELAPAFLAAIVRAGTPAGRADEVSLGIPPKSRWARERYFVQRTLRDLGHQDLLEVLDSDAPWPALEKLAPRVNARLSGR